MQKHSRIRPERGHQGDLANQQLLDSLTQHRLGVHLVEHAVEREDAKLAQLVLLGFGR